MAKKAFESGEIMVYSSKPLDKSLSQFVTPSKMMASDYAGSGEVYSKKVNVNDVAWISGDEGNLVGKSQLTDIWNQANKGLQGIYRDWETDRKSTRLNSSHSGESRMPSSA